MSTYIAFLRAINLGARRTFGKDDLRAAVEGAGCTGVETYLNTGNVLLRSSLRSRVRVESMLEETFLADRGFEVATIVFTPAELRGLAADAAAYGGLVSGGRHYLELLRSRPDADLVADLEALPVPGRLLRLSPRAVHLLVPPDHPNGTGAQLPSPLVKRLGVSTNRTAKVVAELASRWS